MSHSHHLNTPPFGGEVVCYSLTAAADPGVLPRVLAVFARRGIVPSRWHSDVIGGTGLVIDIQVRDLTAGVAEIIASALRQIQYVDVVLTSKKGPGELSRQGPGLPAMAT